MLGGCPCFQGGGACWATTTGAAASTAATTAATEIEERRRMWISPPGDRVSDLSVSPDVTSRRPARSSFAAGVRAAASPGPPASRIPVFTGPGRSGRADRGTRAAIVPGRPRRRLRCDNAADAGGRPARPRSPTTGRHASGRTPHQEVIVARDEHGLETTAAPAALKHYDRAIVELLHFRPDMLTEADEAAREDPTAPMPAALAAFLRLLSTEPGDAAEAARLVAAFREATRGRRFPPREEAHLRAVETWLAGDMHAAGRLLRRITREHPLDALALAVGHQIDFFTGDALSLRDRVAEVVDAWPAGHPHRGPVLGMLAFGVEEAGDYEHAEAIGRQAVELDPADVWGIHAVAHSLEMRARVADGLRFFDERRAAWSDDTGLSVHNWWHHALFTLETGDVEAVLATYDARIHHARSSALALELLDASALLWRLWLDGEEQPARWRALAAAWGPQVATPFYAFNDLHAVMAWVGAGDFARAEALVADRERHLGEPHPGVVNDTMTARIGLPAVRAVMAFARGRYADAIAQLAPIRHHLNEFGGSHAQRDVLHRTLLEAALRADRRDLAAGLLRERIHLKPDSPYNWLKQAQLGRAGGDEAGAADAERRAAALRSAARAGSR
jgi:hypothetical protein